MGRSLEWGLLLSPCNTSKLMVKGDETTRLWGQYWRGPEAIIMDNFMPALC